MFAGYHSIARDESAKHVLIADFDFARSNEVVEANELFEKKKAALALKRRIDSWTAPLELVPSQTLPAYIVRSVRKSHKDETLFENCWYITFQNGLTSGGAYCSV